MTDEASEPSSRSEAAYRRVRAAIIAREFPPGSRMREGELADRLGMSRTPVREALKRLEAEGLLAMAPQRGLIVAELDHQAIVELYDIREVLEGTAAAWAARHASDVEIATMAEIVELEAAVLADPAAMSELNRRLHRAIHYAAHNRYLLRSVQELSETIALLGPRGSSLPGRAAAAHEEHVGIVEAIAARDWAAAEQRARAHIRSAQKSRLRARLDIA